jgi:hypothetical protein
MFVYSRFIIIFGGSSQRIIEKSRYKIGPGRGRGKPAKAPPDPDPGPGAAGVCSRQRTHQLQYHSKFYVGKRTVTSLQYRSCMNTCTAALLPHRTSQIVRSCVVLTTLF